MLELLREKISPDVRAGEPLAKYTTFKLGGPAEFYFEAKTADDAVRAVRGARQLGLAWFVFGGGSNMVVADQGVRGLVIRMVNRGFSVDDDRVTADAGAPTGLVSSRSVDAGLTGFEWAVGLPGTIGGAVRGNGGMFDGEMKDVVESVRVLRDGHDVTVTNAECAFAYRESIFKKNPDMIVLSTVLQLQKTIDPVAAKALLKKYLLTKKDQQPIEWPCAGCIFTNWRPGSPDDLEVLRRVFDVDKNEHIPITSQGTVPAGWLIDRAGLKGMRIGHTMISDKHGNFMIHDGKGTADEVMQLIAVVKTRIRNLTGGVVHLKEEVELVGF